MFCKTYRNVLNCVSSGPPGTGKTSLCKALAQKLVIRLSDRYSYGQLIEINSHSLFSKWFSEVITLYLSVIKEKFLEMFKMYHEYSKINQSVVVLWYFEVSENILSINMYYYLACRVESWWWKCFRKSRSWLMTRMLWCLC